MKVFKFYKFPVVDDDKEILVAHIHFEMRFGFCSRKKHTLLFEKGQNTIHPADRASADHFE